MAQRRAEHLRAGDVRLLRARRTLVLEHMQDPNWFLSSWQFFSMGCSPALAMANFMGAQ